MSKAAPPAATTATIGANSNPGLVRVFPLSASYRNGGNFNCEVTGEGSATVRIDYQTPGSATGSVTVTIVGTNGSPDLTAANWPFSVNSTEPVNLASGEYEMDEPPDLLLGGPLPLFFARYYASHLKANALVPGLTGENWSHNFNWSAAIDALQVEIYSARGQRFRFFRIGGAWVLDSPTFANFQLVDSSTNLVFGDPRARLFYTFDPAGRLTRIADGRGNAHTLTYDGILLTNVADGLGRSLTFTYADVHPLYGFNRLRTVSDGARTITNEYFNAYYPTNPWLAAVRRPLGRDVSYGYAQTNDTFGDALLTSKTFPATGAAPYQQTYDAAGRVVKQKYLNQFDTLFTYTATNTIMTDPLGGARAFFHTAGGSLFKIVDEAGKTLFVTQDPGGRPTAISDRNTNYFQVYYNATTGRPTTFVSGETNSTTFIYSNRTVSGITFSDLAQTTYPDLVSINVGGRLIFAQAKERFVYDANGNVVIYTNRAGQPAFFGYNARGQITAITNPAGGVATLAYNADGTLASRTDAETGTTSFLYDSLRRVTNVVSSDAASVSAQFDLADRMISSTDARGNTTTFGYDANDRLTSVTNALGQRTVFGYDDAGRVVSVRDFAGNTAHFARDALGRVTAATSRTGHVTQFGYDARGRLTAFSDGAGKIWNFGYDAEDQFLSVANPLSQTSSRALNRSGAATASTDGLGQTTRFARDTLQRVTAITNRVGRLFRYFYDAHGGLSQVQNTVLGSVNYYRDQAGRLTNIVTPTGGQWSWEWTPLGRLATMTDPNYLLTTYSRDVRGRVRRIAFADGATRTNTYDAAGNLTRAQYSDSTDLQFAYDALNRLSSANNLAFAYDAMGRVTNTMSSGVNFRATHDAEGRLTSASYSNGLFTVTYAYDARGLLTNVTDSLSGAQLAFAYDAAGRSTNVVRGNGVNSDYTYDAAGRLTRIKDGSVIDLQLGLSPAGEPTALTLTAPIVAGALTNQSRKLNFNSADQITTSGYQFDARGRQTKAPGKNFTWDAANRLVGASNVVFTYNGLNRVVTRAESGATIRYHYNHALGLAPIVAEQDAATGQMLRYYVWSPGGALLYLIDAANGNAVRYFHFDHVGSTLALTDGAGAVTDAYVYTPYGELTGRTGTSAQPFTYVGRWGVRREPTANLYDMRARHYDPVTARFLSRDPNWPRLADEHSVNPYGYAAQSPLRYVDPDGRDQDDRDALNRAAEYLLADGRPPGDLFSVRPETNGPETNEPEIQVESILGDLDKNLIIVDGPVVNLSERQRQRNARYIADAQHLMDRLPFLMPLGGELVDVRLPFVQAILEAVQREVRTTLFWVSLEQSGLLSALGTQAEEDWDDEYCDDSDCPDHLEFCPRCRTDLMRSVFMASMPAKVRKLFRSAVSGGLQW